MGNQSMKKKLSKIIFFLFIALCTGCNKNKQPIHKDIEKSSNPTNSTYYRVRETVLPNADTIIGDSIKKDGYVRQLSLSIQNDTIYRLAQIWNGTLKEPEPNKYFVQVLKPPYKKWSSYETGPNYWKTLFEGNYADERLFVTTNQEIYFLLQNMNLENGYSFVSWNEYSSGKIINTYEGLSSVLWNDSNMREIDMYAERDTYLYQKQSQSVTKLGINFEIEKEYQLAGHIWGTIKNPMDETIYYYGVFDNKFCIWNLESGELILDGLKDIGSFDDNYVQAVCSENGNIFITNGQYLWRLQQNGNLEMVSDFIDQGYLIDKIYDMSCVGETVYLYINEFDMDYIFTIQEEEKPQYMQEITLATYYSPSIQAIVTKFNLRNDKYHIKIVSPKEGESYDDFYREIQMEISSEKGPDLFVLPKEVASGYARNGYLKDMTTFISNPETLWTAALKSAQIDNVQFGIPYNSYLYTTAFLKRLVGDRTSWTLSDLMQIVRNSDIVRIVDSSNYATFINYFGLQDMSNTTFIDWNQGISHLDEGPFIELLEFSHQYINNDNASNTIIDMEQNKTASKYTWNMGIERFIEFVESNNSLAFIGFPCDSGSGIFVLSDFLYMNSMSKNEEGIRAFIDHMLSYNMQYRNAVSRLEQLPIRMDVMEDFIQYLVIQKKMLTEENAELLISLIKRAEPYNYMGEIFSILEEELPAYINDQKTAEEVAAIIHNRVQLYLNENK